jgi:hypothetical protein
MSHPSTSNADLPAVSGTVAFIGVALIVTIVVASFAVLLANRAEAALPTHPAPTTLPSR